ncbi:MAG TPA: HEPN domain-containing protein [Candidatus Aenigmarchaeota archaeon]|nr:HEPN domain-containing protein [Candidatus Aenigmarchaeota archaeon]
MREEVINWFKQAEKDLEAAEKNLKIKEFYIVAFLSQQAVEKALKALYIHKLKESPGTTHSLVFLGSKVKIPKSYYTILRKLNPDFVIARYPDAAFTIPYKLYDKEIASEKLKLAKEIIKWVRKQLK